MLIKTPYRILTILLAVITFSCEKTELNIVPHADAGPAQIIQLPTDFVTLSGNGSDKDGSVEGYLWSKVSGPNIPAIHSPGSATTQVTALIAGVYVFQLMVIDNDGATGLDTVTVTVSPAQLNTLTLQPDQANGQDALVITKSGDNTSGNQNFGQLGELNYSRWTYVAQGFGEGPMRSYIKFTGLSVIPANAQVLSAKLSLYGVPTSAFTPEGNSHYPGSPYGSNPDNPGWIKLVTANWDETSITWNNKPGTSDANQVAIPGTTTQWNYDATDVDVTELVKTMVSTNSNFGFCLVLQDESIYRNVIFSSSESADATRRPKLVVTYQ